MPYVRQSLSGVMLLALLSVNTYAQGRVYRYDDGAGGQMWYRVILPNNYDPNRSYPLTTFLHGSDGTNIRPVVVPELDVEVPPQTLINSLSSGPYESILIAPQLERGTYSINDNDRLIGAVVESVEASYGTDPQRRYLTGASLGGFGTFHMLRAKRNYFAAGVPIAGFYSPPFPPPPGDPFTMDPFADYAQVIGETPIWVFHGSGDAIVRAEASRVVVDALREADHNVRYSELPFAPHDVWTQLYTADQFPATVVFRLEADTVSQTFQLFADLDQEKSRGLNFVYVDLAGVDTVQNLMPKIDSSPASDTPLGFNDLRSADNVAQVMGRQAARTDADNILTGFGQIHGTLPGAGTGTGEVQSEYDAPLLLAEGTFSDLATLDFSMAFYRGSQPSAIANVIPLEPSPRWPYAIGYTELYHDGQLVKSTGDHSELFPWFFEQRLVPEPSTFALFSLVIGVCATRRKAVTRQGASLPVAWPGG